MATKKTKTSKKPKLLGILKGLKIDEIEIERAKNWGDSIKQVYISECEHNWVWYPDETSTFKFAGYWRCSKCGLFRFN